MGVIKRQSLKSSIVNYLGVGLGAVFFFLIFPHIISEEYLGFVQMLIAVAAVFAQLISVGMPSVLYRFYDRWKNSVKLSNFHSLALVLITIAFAVFIPLCFIFKEDIINFYGKDSPLVSKYFWAIFPLVLIQAYTFYFEMYSMMLHRVTVPTFLREFLNKVLLILIVFLLAKNLISEELFVIFYIAVYLVSLSVLIFYAVKCFQFKLGTVKGFIQNNIHKKEVSSYARSATGLSFLMNLQNFADALLIPAILSMSMLGIYGRPLILGVLIHVPYRSIANISAPIIMEAISNNDMRKVADLNKKISVNLFLIGIFLFTLVVANGDNFFRLLPPQYAVAKNVLYIIATGRLIDMAFGLNSEILFSTKYYRWAVYFTIIMVALVFALNLILLPKIGIDGAAIAAAASLVVFNILKTIFIYVKYKFHNFSFAYIPMILIALAVIFIATFIPFVEWTWLNELMNIKRADVIVNMAAKSLIVLILFIPPIIALKISPDFNDFFKLIITGKIFRGGHKMEEL